MVAEVAHGSCTDVPPARKQLLHLSCMRRQVKGRKSSQIGQPLGMMRHNRTRLRCRSAHQLVADQNSVERGNEIMSMSWQSHDMHAALAQHISTPPRPVHNDVVL